MSGSTVKSRNVKSSQAKPHICGQVSISFTIVKALPSDEMCFSIFYKEKEKYGMVARNVVVVARPFVRWRSVHRHRVCLNTRIVRLLGNILQYVTTRNAIIC